MRRSNVYTANLESGRPTANEALQRLDFELAQARRAGCAAMKIIHGYDSSGAGGVLRDVVQQALRQMVADGKIRAMVAGEDWRISDETAWLIRNTVPELKNDRDLGKGNKGISIVLL
ncbi:MAG: Smr/MutS family protein [Terriglobales bacterium]